MPEYLFFHRHLIHDAWDEMRQQHPESIDRSEQHVKQRFSNALSWEITSISTYGAATRLFFKSLPV